MMGKTVLVDPDDGGACSVVPEECEAQGIDSGVIVGDAPGAAGVSRKDATRQSEIGEVSANEAPSTTSVAAAAAVASTATGDNGTGTIASQAGEEAPDSISSARRNQSQPGAVHVPGITELRRQTAVSGTGGAVETDAGTDAAASGTIVESIAIDTVAQASLVTEPPIYEASKVKEPFCSVTVCGKRTNVVWIGLASLAAVALAAGLAAGLSKTQPSPSPSLLPSPPDGLDEMPRPAPTRAPTRTDPRADEIEAVIVDHVSGPVALQESTPQNQALRWLIDADPLGRNASSPYLIQRYVLMLLFYALGGEAWVDRTGYGTGVGECDGWFGADCDGTGFVSSLDLEGNNLVGAEIPREVSNLASLSRLSLPRNSIRGTIPTSIGGLADLNILYLYDNFLSGTLPSEIGNLRKLQYMNLEGNQLRGAIPTQFGHLSDLQVLNLRAANFNSTFPTILLGMTNLTTLVLGNTYLRGAIPTEIGNLGQLEVLKLNINEMTSTIPTEFGQLELLQWLELSQNMLTGTIPLSFGRLNHLHRLLLHRNDLIGVVPDSLCNASSSSIKRFSTDCKGPMAEVHCSCCTDCCNDTDTFAIFSILGELC